MDPSRFAVRFVRSSWLMAILIAMAFSIHAQVNGSILGSATDTSKSAVPSVAVRVVNIETNLTQDTVTDALGQYRFLVLPVGRYRLEATLRGFQKFVAADIELKANEQHCMDFTMQVGRLEQHAEVLANSVRVETDLSGTWTFTPDGQSATTIQVPGGGWHKQGFTSVNAANYERTITVPNLGQPQVTKIEFGAVNFQASLYINNNLVGTNTTSYTPSVFDITNFVTPGQDYTLRVYVKGRNAMLQGGKTVVPDPAPWSPHGAQGIFRSAQIVAYPQKYMSDVFVRPSVQNDQLYFDVWVKNGSASGQSLTISSNLSSWNGHAWTYPSIADELFTANPGTTKVTIGPITWGLGTASYWWPNVPYQSGYTAELHNLNLTLKQAENTLDTKTVRFGFKELLQQAERGNVYYFLNGTRVNFRGDSLQGADYDQVNYGGYGDAYDTLPGFLPGVNGWPKAVDNYQRLNYNFVRLHQQPVTPYMLDVCDEKGLMVMEETAIRGSNGATDFAAGHDNMVNHLTALFTRDRNHASIVRYSQCNEPDLETTDSTQFETDLYDATMAVDNTRPISIDSHHATYDGFTYSNFSVYRHYGPNAAAVGTYTDEVFARSDRPFGEGEFIWYADNSRAGFTWFATGTQAMRRKDASDVRPYTLLSAWASLIPGVNTGDMFLEQGYFPDWLTPALVPWGYYPLYGENDLPDPWSNYQIQRVQAGFNPVLVADRDYWEANKRSDSNGDWPISPGTLAPNSSVTRTLDIYNDTFSGTTVDVYWEQRSGSPTGTLISSGELHPIIPLGSRSTQTITFTTPASGTIYLVLYSKKSGMEMFRENNVWFNLDAAGSNLNLVLNPSFENCTQSSCDSIAPWGEWSSVGSWTVYAETNGGSPDGAEHLTHYNLYNGDSWYQSWNNQYLTVEPGVPYTFTFMGMKWGTLTYTGVVVKGCITETWYPVTSGDWTTYTFSTNLVPTNTSCEIGVWTEAPGGNGTWAGAFYDNFQFRKN